MNNIGSRSIRNINTPTTNRMRMITASTHTLKPMGTRMTTRLTRILAEHSHEHGRGLTEIRQIISAASISGRHKENRHPNF